MAANPVTILSGERRLYGVLERPQGPERGGVVLVHGWDGCRVGPHRILVEAARHLNGLGLATLRFDLSGRGESDGDPLRTDLDMMISDASAALDELKTRLSSPVPIAALGMCSGGNVALAASAFRDDVRAVVAWSTYPFQEQRSAAQDLRRTGHFAGVYLGKALRAETWKKLLTGRVNLGMVRKVLLGHYAAGEGTQRDLQRSRRDVLSAISGYEGRVLLLFGAKDPEAVDAERLFREFCSQHGLAADFESIAGANHNFHSLAWKRQAVEATGRWLTDVLAG
jgi:dienelactone hydrolase